MQLLDSQINLLDTMGVIPWQRHCVLPCAFFQGGLEIPVKSRHGPVSADWVFLLPELPEKGDVYALLIAIGTAIGGNVCYLAIAPEDEAKYELQPKYTLSPWVQGIVVFGTQCRHWMSRDLTSHIQWVEVPALATLLANPLDKKEVWEKLTQMMVKK